LKTKQVRPQRRLLGGESAVEGDRIIIIIIIVIIIIIIAEIRVTLSLKSCSGTKQKCQ